MRKHPRLALGFLWSIDLLAILITLYSVQNLLSYPSTEWMHFLIWTVILGIARLSGLIEHIGMKVSSGFATAIEFAAVIVLPFPFLCVAVIISYGVNILERIRRKHPDPFIGPDFNASTVIIAGLCVQVLGEYLTSSLLSETFALLPKLFLFSIVQILLLTIMLSLDMRKHWKQVGTTSIDFLITEAVFITAGALVGRIYQLDHWLIGLTFLPVIFLHHALQKVNEAKLAYIDAKTGVYNYRYFDETYVDLFEKSVQSNQPLGLIFADMDHLRDINNNYGHQIGDVAIVAVAKALQGEAGADATIARFGGEEFVIILPDYTSEKTVVVAERLRKAVENIKVPLESGDALKLSISLGVASYPQDVSNSEELIKAADMAVYAAKHAGRNQVKTFMAAS